MTLSPRDWPGVHSAAALVDGEPLVGEWIDRSGYYRARQKDPDASIRDFTETYEVHLEPLPCWRHLGETEWRSRVAGIVDRIEKETLEMHHRKGTVPLGARVVRKANPHRRPNFETRSPRIEGRLDWPKARFFNMRLIPKSIRNPGASRAGERPRASQPASLTV